MTIVLTSCWLVRAEGLTCGSEGPIMVNRVSTVRKLLFLLFCHVGFVTSQNPHTWHSGGFNKYAPWDGSRDFSERATLGLP